MRVKELKEKLEQFDDNLIIMIPNQDYGYSSLQFVPARNIIQGVNELDGCLFIDAFEEED